MRSAAARTGTASITWSTAGSAAVSVSNSGCPGLSASHNVAIYSAPAAVSLTSFPSVLVQEPNSGGASSTFTVTNDGDTATSLSLSQQGNFFTVAPVTVHAGARGLESRILNDVVTTFFGVAGDSAFGVAGDSAGYLTVTPPPGGTLAG